MTSLFEDYEPYNPLDEKNLARGVADALEREPVQVLPPRQFPGAGLYALYYVGDFELYAPLAELAREDSAPSDLGVGPYAIPIYVGKAAASGSRHGRLQESTDKTLFSRIKKHSRSIEAALTTLNVHDFRVRYLRVKDIWIPLGEYGLLQRYTPIWNRVLDGFGNNDPGGGRYNQARSSWDTLHPGRAWAQRLVDNSEPISEIERRVRQAVAASVQHRPVPASALSQDSLF
ncbi:hypothetical protein GCM10009530_56910 [Microbispora corallina]|uniref:Eco29kI family restriction endonuclease n=1 Tax=Microbispora corallina TaxID=83302 RepID=A0ABQ4G935_9ACTN|nr:Eco29kI family restriction endonuclease [Microbispora corallina]GIH43488.1 hypothetical protein Mco01_64880 [Microbispora corallina]